MLDLLIFIWELIGIFVGGFILVSMLLLAIMILIAPIANKIEDDMNN